MERNSWARREKADGESKDMRCLLVKFSCKNLQEYLIVFNEDMLGTKKRIEMELNSNSGQLPQNHRPDFHHVKVKINLKQQK